MTGKPVAVVFDCMIFLQGLGRTSGPSRRCLELVDQGHVVLYLSLAILTEIEDVLGRPSIRRKFPGVEGAISLSLGTSVT